MSSLILKDLRHHAPQWAWSLLVTTIGGLLVGVIVVSWNSAHSWAAAQPHASGYIASTHVLGLNLVNYIGLAIAAVVSSTLSLTVAAQARAHALWKIVGIPAARIHWAILGQIAVVGLVGGLIGGVLSPLVARWYLLTWQEFKVFPADMPVVAPVYTLALTMALTAAFSLLGGLGAARRAAATPEMQALREAVAPAARTRPWQWVVAGLMLMNVIAILLIAVLATSGADISDLDPELAQEVAQGQVAGGAGIVEVAGGVTGMLLLITALCVPVWTVRPVLSAWTALVPGRSPAWFTARANARHRASLSLTTVVPFAIAVGMTGTVYSTVGALNATGAPGQVNGYATIAIPIFVIAGVGGVANIAMVGGSRRQEGALLGVLGAEGRTLLLTTVLEGAIYAVTGTLVGLAATLLSAVLSALLTGGGTAVLLAALPVHALAPVIVAVLVLAVAATWLPAQLDRRPMMERLRQPV